MSARQTLFIIALNRCYLLQALRFGLNRLEIEDDLNPVVCADSNGAKKMIIMPVNLDDSTVRGQGSAQSSPEATPPPAPPTAPQEPPGPTSEER